MEIKQLGNRNTTLHEKKEALLYNMLYYMAYISISSANGYQEHILSESSSVERSMTSTLPDPALGTKLDSGSSMVRSTTLAENDNAAWPDLEPLWTSAVSSWPSSSSMVRSMTSAENEDVAQPARDPELLGTGLDLGFELEICQYLCQEAVFEL